MKTPPKQPAPASDSFTSQEVIELNKLAAQRASDSLRNMPRMTLEQAKAQGALTSRDETDSTTLSPEEASMHRLAAMRAYISLRNMPRVTLEQAKAQGKLTSREESDSEL